MKKVGVLISGRGSNLQALIEACAAPGFPAEIGLVLSNKAAAVGLARAEAAGIPTAVLPHKNFETKAAFEEAMTEALEQAEIELVCLAGFMRLLSPVFVDHWRDRLLNIHPSLLPSFRGIDVHERVIASGVRVSGCTVHYVRAEMDDGPILGQAAVPVLGEDTPESLAERVLQAEHLLYPACLRLVAEGRVRIVTERAILEQEGPTPQLPGPLVSFGA